MKVQILDSQKEREHCNFCKRGKYDGFKMQFPYSIVYQMRNSDGGGLVANVCPDCVKELMSGILSPAPGANGEG